MRLEVLTKERAKIFSKLNIFSDFYLAGGTALALQIGHRISVDFDLFSPKEIKRSLLAKVKKVYRDNKVAVSVNNSDELTVFLGKIKVTFFHYPFPVILPLVKAAGVKMLSVSELAATKAHTIGHRGVLKDYIDLYFVISQGFVSLKRIITLALKKYGADFNARLFLEQLIYLEDVPEEKILFLKKSVSKNQIARFFIKKVKELKLSNF